MMKLWYFDAKSWLTGKDPDTGKDWGEEEKGIRRLDGDPLITTQGT